MEFNILGDKRIKDYNYLPLYIKNEQRYCVMKSLGEKNIQTTLYYYPIRITFLPLSLKDDEQQINDVGIRTVQHK